MWFLINFAISLAVLVTWNEIVVKPKNLVSKKWGERLGVFVGALTVLVFWPYYFWRLITKYL